MLISALATWAVVVGIESVGVEKAAEFARLLGISSTFIVGLHLFVVRQLYELRDVDELKGDERGTLRAIIHRRTSAIWVWVVVVVALGVASVAAPALIPIGGVGVVYLAWMGAAWTLYSLLLIPLWSGEIASFKSLIADRKRERDARDAALIAITSDAEKGWSQIEALNAYTRPPE